MRLLVLVLLFIGWQNCLAQQVMVQPSPALESLNQIIKIDQDKTYSEPEQNFHRYVCQRCGSENAVSWSADLKGGIEFIPHCNFCGKKYWPKFNPYSVIQRTYCSEVKPTQVY